MSRIANVSGNRTRAANRAVEHRKRPVLAPSTHLLERWQNLAGDELEQTGDYSIEERHFADTFAHEYGDLEAGLND